PLPISGDTCAEGVCSGIPTVCDDGIACNGVETCNPSTGTCDSGEPVCEEGVCDANEDTCVSDCSGGCLVEDVCYAEAQASPHEPCLGCNPSVSVTEFSPAVGAACGHDADPCLLVGTCNEAGDCDRLPAAQGTPGG